MNREGYLNLHEELCAKSIAIAKAKNADYSSGDDPFRNFRIVGALGLSPEHGFITRMSDKLARIANIISTGQQHVKDESVEDTLLDLSNYCILLIGFLRDKAERESPVFK